jgi:hypothetical protein
MPGGGFFRLLGRSRLSVTFDSYNLLGQKAVSRSLAVCRAI